MPMRMCESGKHFYNPDVYDECPTCQEDKKNNSKIDEPPNIPKTDKVDESNNKSFEIKNHNQVPKTQLRNSRLNKESETSEPTDNPFKKKQGAPTPKGTQVILGGKKFETGKSQNDLELPVAGWLVIIEGPGKGRDFRLIQGDNKIGRNDDMEVCLNFGVYSDETVSREAHATVVYDANANEFFVIRGSSRNLPMLNEKTIRSDQNMSSKDVLQVGQTKLLFVPLCGENFKW